MVLTCNVLRFRALLERLRETLWFLPTISAVLSVVAGFVLTRFGSLDGTPMSSFIAAPDAGNVRTLLSTVLGAMIAATSIVSSLTIVALQTASTQFSPRLLRNFLRDRTTQWVLAFFVGTSGLLVTLIVEADDDSAGLAVTVAFVAVLVSVIVIAFFFNHVSQSIRVESIMASIVEETCAAAGRLDEWLESGSAHTTTDTAKEMIPRAAHPAIATHSGYVQQIDACALGRRATELGIAVRLVPQLGQPVTRRTPLAWWWQLPGADSSKTVHHDGCDHETVGALIAAHVGVGYERTMHHDVGLGIRQLVDMSIKAMSPAVNDPYTAMQAVDHLGTILVRLADLPLGDRAWPDHQGIDRVTVPTAAFVDYAALACDQLRRYGGREPAVLIRLMNMIRVVAFAGDDVDRAVLRPLVERCGEPCDLDADDARLVRATRDEVLAWFDHRVEPSSAQRHGL